MSRNPLRLKIAYLYPDILQSSCDRANIEVFYKRAKWRDIDVDVQEINAYDRIGSPSKYDFYYIGGSNTESMNFCLKHLKTNEEELKIATFALVPMLAVNCGYQLIGNYFQPHNKAQTEGIKILNVNSIAGKKIRYGNVVGNCNFLRRKVIVGFENHTMTTHLFENTSPFLTLQKGFGNNKDNTEGARFNNVIGTYIVSPIFAQNPNLCDFFIAASLRIKYKCKIPLTHLYDDIEWYSHDYIQNAK